MVRIEIEAQSRKQGCKYNVLTKNVIICKKAMDIEVTGNGEKPCPERWGLPEPSVNSYHPRVYHPAVYAGPWGWFVPDVEREMNSLCCHSLFIEHISACTQGLPDMFFILN